MIQSHIIILNPLSPHLIMHHLNNNTFFVGIEGIYSIKGAPTLSAIRLVTKKLRGESIQHSVTSNVHVYFAHR